MVAAVAAAWLVAAVAGSGGIASPETPRGPVTRLSTEPSRPELRVAEPSRALHLPLEPRRLAAELGAASRESSASRELPAALLPITGRVSTRTGTPLPGIEVTAVPMGVAEGQEPDLEFTQAVRTRPDGSFLVRPAVDRPHRLRVTPLGINGEIRGATPGSGGWTLWAGDAMVTLRVSHPSCGFPQVPSVELNRGSLRHHSPGPTVHWIDADDGGDLGRGVVVLRGVTQGIGVTTLHVRSEVDGATWRERAVIDQFVPPDQIRDVHFDITLEREDD